jgi:hypothetical protein
MEGGQVVIGSLQSAKKCSNNSAMGELSIATLFALLVRLHDWCTGQRHAPIVHLSCYVSAVTIFFSVHSF